MDSVIIDGKESQLLQLTFWFQTKYEKGCNVSVQVGSRAAMTHHDYLPMTRIYFYNVACQDDMPVFIVTYNSIKMPIDSSAWLEPGHGKVGSEDIILHFQLAFVTSLKSLEHKYCSTKEDEDKYTRCEGLSNFIGSESQFLSLFQRNEEIEEIKVAEIEEEKYERTISNEILKLQRSKLDCKIIFGLLVLFLVFGYLFQAIERSGNQAQKQEFRKVQKRLKLNEKKRENQKKGAKSNKNKKQ